jgi:hypothetical protein
MFYPGFSPPALLYYHTGREYPLWEPKYSGGLENLINLQEAWNQTDGSGVVTSRTLRFFGSLIMPWDSYDLQKTDGTPAFYSTLYYNAPIRDFNYNANLANSNHYTPLLIASNQQTFAISRRQFSEKSGS